MWPCCWRSSTGLVCAPCWDGEFRCASFLTVLPRRLPNLPFEENVEVFRMLNTDQLRDAMDRVFGLNEELLGPGKLDRPDLGMG
jgi:hypothetical protein